MTQRSPSEFFSNLSLSLSLSLSVLSSDRENRSAAIFSTALCSTFVSLRFVFRALHSLSLSFSRFLCTVAGNEQRAAIIKNLMDRVTVVKSNLERCNQNSECGSHNRKGNGRARCRFITDRIDLIACFACFRGVWPADGNGGEERKKEIGMFQR